MYIKELFLLLPMKIIAVVLTERTTLNWNAPHWGIDQSRHITNHTASTLETFYCILFFMSNLSKHHHWQTWEVHKSKSNMKKD